MLIQIAVIPIYDTNPDLVNHPFPLPVSSHSPGLTLKKRPEYFKLWYADLELDGIKLYGEHLAEYPAKFAHQVGMSDTSSFAVPNSNMTKLLHNLELIDISMSICLETPLDTSPSYSLTAWSPIIIFPCIDNYASDLSLAREISPSGA